MKLNVIFIFSIIAGIILFNGCLHDRDNPNDPGASNNLVEGYPDIRVRGYSLNDGGFVNIPDANNFNIGSINRNDTLDTVFYIENLGTGYLHLTHFQMDPLDEEFSVITSPYTPVWPGSSTSFKIRFDPGGVAGNYTALIMLSYLDEGYFDASEEIYNFNIEITASP